jgi:hypothetical protein
MIVQRTRLRYHDFVAVRCTAILTGTATLGSSVGFLAQRLQLGGWPWNLGPLGYPTALGCSPDSICPYRGDTTLLPLSYDGKDVVVPRGGIIALPSPVY